MKSKVDSIKELKTKTIKIKNKHDLKWLNLILWVVIVIQRLISQFQ